MSGCRKRPKKVETTTVSFIHTFTEIIKRFVSGGYDDNGRNMIAASIKETISLKIQRITTCSLCITSTHLYSQFLQNKRNKEEEKDHGRKEIELYTYIQGTVIDKQRGTLKVPV